MLWIDADPQSNLTFYAGIEDDGGRNLNQVLRGKLPIEDSVHPLAWPNLFIVPSGANLFEINEYLSSSGNGGGVLRKRLRSIHDWFDYCLIDAPPARSQVVITVVGSASRVLIPVEATVKGSKCLLETLDMLQTLSDLEIWQGDILGVLPFRDRWIGYTQCKDARENLEMIKSVEPRLCILPSILESEQYKKAIRAGKTLTDLGYPQLDRPFQAIIEKLEIGQ